MLEEDGKHLHRPRAGGTKANRHTPTPRGDYSGVNFEQFCVGNQLFPASFGSCRIFVRAFVVSALSPNMNRASLKDKQVIRHASPGSDLLDTDSEVDEFAQNVAESDISSDDQDGEQGDGIAQWEPDEWDDDAAIGRFSGSSTEEGSDVGEDSKSPSGRPS
jgi:hypothetical protein